MSECEIRERVCGCRRERIWQRSSGRDKEGNLGNHRGISQHHVIAHNITSSY